jgi:hypothetical protein
MAQQIRERLDKLDYMKLKSLFRTKKNGLQIEEAVHRMGKNFVSYTFEKGFIIRI